MDFKVSKHKMILILLSLNLFIMFESEYAPALTGSMKQSSWGWYEDAKIAINESSASARTGVPTNWNWTIDPLNTNYTWVGNRWIPPKGVPFYSPSDIRRIFQKENTVWWGDSTARQDSNTMYSMMNTPDILDISVTDLQKNVNYGKARPIDHCTIRNTTLVNDDIWSSICRQVNGTNSSQNIGKFDLVDNKCIWTLARDLISFNSTFQRDYTVMIVSTGIWDVVRPGNCVAPDEKPHQSSLIDALDALKNISSPSFFVIWKTHGHSSKEDEQAKKKSSEIVDITRQWFSNNTPQYMALADFGTAILPRTFGETRISGDLAPHWGLEGRTLSIQMITHLVETFNKNKQRNMS